MVSTIKQHMRKAIVHAASLAFVGCIAPAHADSSVDDMVRQLSFASDGADFAKEIKLTSRDLRLPDLTGLCAGAQQTTSRSKDFEIIEAPPAGAPQLSLALQFVNNKFTMTDVDKKQLNKLALALTDPGLMQARFVVAGHTDATGEVVANRKLSCGRSIAVRDYLIGKKVAPERLSAYGYGHDQPIERGVTASSINRRVEIRRAE